MTEHNDSTDVEPAEQENEHWIKHVDTVPIRIKRETESNGYSHVVHLTKAVRQVADQTGTPISDVFDSDIEFRNDMYDEDEGTLPAPVYLEQPSGGGKGREMWRTFVANGTRQDGTPSSITLRVPESSIEVLGFEPETCEGELVEVWVADDLLVFSRPQQGVFNIKIPRDVADSVDFGDAIESDDVEAVEA